MIYRYAVLTARHLDCCVTRSDADLQGGWVHINLLMNIFVKNDCSSKRNEIPYLHHTRRLIYSVVQR